MIEKTLQSIQGNGLNPQCMWWDKDKQIERGLKKIMKPNITKKTPTLIELEKKNYFQSIYY